MFGPLLTPDGGLPRTRYSYSYPNFSYASDNPGHLFGNKDGEAAEDPLSTLVYITSCVCHSLQTHLIGVPGVSVHKAEPRAFVIIESPSSQL